MTVLRSIWAWFSFGAILILWLPIIGFVRLFDRDPGRYRTGRWFRRMGSAITRANPVWHVAISGSYPENVRQPFVVVCNHQSLADIPVLSNLPWDMKWVTKASLFDLPVLGWMLKASGDIPVRRESLRSRAQVFIEAKKRLRNRISVLIMPEGTRSPNGKIQAFSDGPFKLAVREGVQVLPLAVDGTFSALPRKSWKFGRKCWIRLHVFDAVDPASLGNNAAELTEHVRRMIILKVAEWRGVTADEVDGVRVEDGNAQPAGQYS